MGNVAAWKAGMVQLTALVSDWDWSASAPDHMKDLRPGPEITKIVFFGGATGDQLYITDGSATGKLMAILTCVAKTGSYATPVEADFTNMKSRFLPYVDYSKCTFSTGHVVQIHFP